MALCYQENIIIDNAALVQSHNLGSSIITHKPGQLRGGPKNGSPSQFRISKKLYIFKTKISNLQKNYNIESY